MLHRVLRLRFHAYPTYPPLRSGTSTVNLINLANPRLLGLTRALGPVTLRIGGSLDNKVKYYVGNMTREECEAPVSFRDELWPNLCLNMSRWEDVLNFVGVSLAPGSQLVFGVQLSVDAAGWNSTNVLDFLNATSLMAGNRVLAGIEVGEETNPAPGTADFSSLVDAYKGVKAAVDTFWPNASGARPAIHGPCSGMNENVVPFTWSTAFVNAVGDALDVYTMHSYNNDGGNSWKVPGFLNQTAVQAAAIRGMLDTVSPSTKPLPLSCGE